MSRLTNCARSCLKLRSVSMKAVLFVCVVLVVLPNGSECVKLKKALKKGLFLHAALQLLGEKKPAMQMMTMAMPMPMGPVMLPSSGGMTLPKTPCRIPEAVDLSDFILHHHHHHDLHVDVITDNSMISNMNGMNNGGGNNMDNKKMMMKMKMMMMMKPPVDAAEPPSELPDGEVGRPEMEDFPADTAESTGGDQRPMGGSPTSENEPDLMAPMPPPTRYGFSSGGLSAPLRLKGGHRRVSRTRSMEHVNTGYMKNT